MDSVDGVGFHVTRAHTLFQPEWCAEWSQNRLKVDVLITWNKNSKMEFLWVAVAFRREIIAIDRNIVENEMNEPISLVF
jgi:hypothetical protein